MGDEALKAPQVTVTVPNPTLDPAAIAHDQVTRPAASASLAVNPSAPLTVPKGVA